MKTKYRENRRVQLPCCGWSLAWFVSYNYIGTDNPTHEFMSERVVITVSRLGINRVQWRILLMVTRTNIFLFDGKKSSWTIHRRPAQIASIRGNVAYTPVSRGYNKGVGYGNRASDGREGDILPNFRGRSK